MTAPWATRNRLLAKPALLGIGAAVLLTCLPVAQAETPASATPGKLSFYTDKTRLWKNRSQIICFQLPEPAAADQTFSCIADVTALDVLMPPKVLKGEKIGYLRVKALTEGKTKLEVDGAKIDLEVVKDPAIALIGELNPRIISPASGASVWGDFSVGVEQLSLGDASQLPTPVLHLPNGKEVAGHIVPNQMPSQYARWVYDLNANDLPIGTNKLVVYGKDANGHDAVSNDIQVQSVRPDPSAIFGGLCKDHNANDRPPKTGGSGGNPRIISDPQLGPGVVTDLNGGAWCLPLTLEKRGLYQIFVTARGDIGGDGLPSLGVAIDEDGQSGSTSRLATTEWRRVPIGHPIALLEGNHILSVRTGNRFSQGKDDSRGAAIEKFELARLDAPPVKIAGASTETTDPTLPMTGGAQPMMDMQAMDNHGRVDAGEVHVVFTDNIDGQVVAGAVDFNVRAYPDQGKNKAPKIELLVNKKVVATQTAVAPHFTVDPSNFVTGANSLQLRAIFANGREAQSETLSVELPADFPKPATGDAKSDATPPVVSVTYTPRAVESGLADAVVARVMDNHHVAAADLVIDDQPQHLDQVPLHGLGQVVLPLLTRDLKPGTHTIKVVARDDAGHETASAVTNFLLTNENGAPPTKYQRASFLLNRLGYGPEPGEIAALLTMGEKPWLESRLAQGITTAGELNQREWNDAQNNRMRSEAELPVNAVQDLVTQPNPVRAHFLVWTENHFNTWLRKDGVRAKATEHQYFMELGPAPFFDLLFTSSTSPAMLVYLDQRESFAKRLNENYAREIMELHTLGVKGGYTQVDVTTLADLLTGWTLASQPPEDGTPGGEGDRYFGYDATLNSGKASKIFGLEFPAAEPAKRFDRVLMALEMLTAHPSCAHFISRKLCEEYVSVPAPPELVDSLAKVYLETGGDMSAMLVAMAQQSAFWSSPAKVADPIEFGVRSARMARSTNINPVSRFAFTSGMGMFDRATPDGYPADDGYSVNSNALLQRWRFAKNFQGEYIRAGIIPKAWMPPQDGPWTPEATQRLVDVAAFRITGNTLGPASNDAAQKLLASAQGSTEARLRTLTTFVCQTPENSLK